MDSPERYEVERQVAVEAAEVSPVRDDFNPYALDVIEADWQELPSSSPHTPSVYDGLGDGDIYIDARGPQPNVDGQGIYDGPLGLSGPGGSAEGPDVAPEGQRTSPEGSLAPPDVPSALNFVDQHAHSGLIEEFIVAEQFDHLRAKEGW